MLSNIVFNSKNVKLSVVKEFFFARFLKGKNIKGIFSHISSTIIIASYSYLITKKAQANEAKLNTMENVFQLNKSFQSKVPETSEKLRIKVGNTH